jgi:hypothetical protein
MHSGIACRTGSFTMHRPIIPFALALMAGAACAVAQPPVSDQKTEEIKKENLPPPATEPKAAEQTGTTEPSSKIAGTSTHPNAVFQKGVLTVPGAVTDVDTAPAKHWGRTDRDDQIPIAGYRLKKLADGDLQKIAQELASQRDAPTASPGGGSYAVIGAEVPAPTAMQSLMPMPDKLTERFAELRGTGFMRSGGKLLIVDRNTNRVVGVL